MPSRWFRISFARTAFLRLLDEEGLTLDALSVMHGVRAMATFFAESRPQHGERDELEAAWGPSEDGYEFAVSRRMQRHDQPEVRLSLVFTYSARADRIATGRASIRTWRDVRELEGYTAVRGARPLRRRLDQS